MPEEDEPPLELALFFPHVLVASHPSLLQVRLTNRSPQPLRAIEIAVESRGLAEPATKRLGRLAAGQVRTQPLEIEPSRSGQYVLQVSIGYELTGQHYNFHGSRSLRINEVPDHRISINIGDIQSNAGGGSNANLGAEYGNVQISNLLGGSSIRTLNDLLDFEFPEQFAPLPLELDYELSVRALSGDVAARQRALQIPPVFLGGVQCGTRCVWHSVQASTLLTPKWCWWVTRRWR